MTTPEPQNGTAVILAGGQGKRCQGNDKGLLLFHQRPVIETILESIAPRVSQLLINANRNTEIYARYGYPVIQDDIPGYQGPLAGFATALAHATTPCVLILPCDGPFIPTDYLPRMCQAIEQQQTELAVAHDGTRLQPVHALIRVSLLESLNTYLHSGERKIDRWYARHQVVQVDFSDRPELFLNINTAEQLTALEAVDHA